MKTLKCVWILLVVFWGIAIVDHPVLAQSIGEGGSIAEGPFNHAPVAHDDAFVY